MMDMKVTENLEQRQIALEEESLGLGRMQYRKAASGPQENTQVGRRLINTAALRLLPAIEKDIEDALGGGSGSNRNIWTAYALQAIRKTIGPEQLAFAVANRCIQVLALGDSLSVQTVADEIAGLLEGTVDYAALEKAYPELYRQVLKLNGKRRRIEKRRAMARVNATRTQQDTGWSLTARTNLGLRLIKLFCESTGLASIDPVWAPKKRRGVPNTPLQVVPSRAAVEALETAHKNAEGLCPKRFPMVVPPRDWTAADKGGYLTEELRQVIIKPGRKNSLQRTANPVGFAHEEGSSL